MTLTKEDAKVLASRFRSWEPDADLRKIVHKLRRKAGLFVDKAPYVYECTRGHRTSLNDKNINAYGPALSIPCGVCSAYGLTIRHADRVRSYQ